MDELHISSASSNDELQGEYEEPTEGFDNGAGVWYSDGEKEIMEIAMNGPILSRAQLINKDQLENNEDSGCCDSRTNSQAPITPKRKRGRPRKDSGNAPKSVSFQPEEPPVRIPTPAEAAQKERRDTALKMASQMLPAFDKAVREERKRSGVDWDVTVLIDAEERKQKEALLNKIEMYYRHYPDECWETSTRRTKWSLKTGLKELEDEVLRCKRELSMKRAMYMTEKGHSFLMHGLEYAAIHGFGVPAHGLADKAKRSRELFEDELKELAIDHLDMFNMSAKGRYAMSVAMLFKSVIDENAKFMVSSSTGVAPSSSEQKAVNEELLRKYANL